MPLPGSLTGTIDFIVGDELFQTWFIASHSVAEIRNSTHIPLVALHGGPGISHSYMLPHFELSSSHGIPVILYDQIGIGKSTHLPDKPPSFWTPNLFMDELENVLTYFGISERFDLLGHSWGGMLAAQFAAERQPAGLNRLIISGACASIKLLAAATTGLLRAFPKEFRDIVHKHEADGTTDSEEYQEAMQKFYLKHICQIDPFPDVLQASFGAMGEDPTVYSTMIGPSEFNINGTLKTWSIIDILPNIKVPTLVTNGQDDEAQDEGVLPFFQRIPKIKWAHFSKSHIPCLEEPEHYFKVVTDFLKSPLVF